VADVVSAVRSYILAQSSVTDVISQRMYLDVLRQNATLPAATISKTSESHVHTLSDRSGLVQTRLQIECYSENRLTTNALAEAIYKCGIVALKGTQSGVDIRGVMVEDGQRNYIIEDSKGGDDHRYVTQFDLMVSYRE
jgi:hypothetical protein